MKIAVTTQERRQITEEIIFFVLSKFKLIILNRSISFNNNSSKKGYCPNTASSVLSEKHIQNPVTHLRWSFLGKQLTAFSRYIFSPKLYLQMVDRLLNTPLHRLTPVVTWPSLNVRTTSITDKIYHMNLQMYV